MMHPLAVFIDEAADEGLLARQVLDHLDSEATEPQVLPIKAAADLLVAALLVAEMRREIALEKFVGALDRPHRDRHVVEAHPNPFNHVETGSLIRRKQTKSFFGHGVDSPRSTRAPSG